MKGKVLPAFLAIFMLAGSGSALAMKMVECDKDRCNCIDGVCYCPADACRAN